jgi:hypothetical protein
MLSMLIPQITLAEGVGLDLVVSHQSIPNPSIHGSLEVP